MSLLITGLSAAAEAVLRSESDLNKLDSYAGDGDLGVSMSAGAAAVLEMLPSFDGRPTGDVLQACGAALARTAPSTCGTLIATGFLRAARAANTDTNLPEELARLLDTAALGIAERGKAQPGEKTVLDALAPAASAAKQAVEASGATVSGVLNAAAEAADAGARATENMTPRHGRAGWLRERSAGHLDAGAYMVAVGLAAAADAVRRAQET